MKVKLDRQVRFQKHLTLPKEAGDPGKKKSCILGSPQSSKNPGHVTENSGHVTEDIGRVTKILQSRDGLPTHLDPFSHFFGQEKWRIPTCSNHLQMSSAADRRCPEVNILICVGGQRDFCSTSRPPLPRTLISSRLRTNSEALVSTDK